LGGCRSAWTSRSKTGSSARLARSTGRSAIPLKKSASKAAVSANIKEMKKAGHSQAQSVAAALRVADEAKKKKRKKK
jgi:hypothetical protein